MFPVSGLAPGTYTVVAYAFSLVAINFNNTFSFVVTVDRTLQPPVIQPGGNVYGAPMNISMSAEPDVEIRYTLDGTIPTAFSACTRGRSCSAPVPS